MTTTPEPPYNPEHPDPQHENPDGETDNPADTQPPEGVEPDPGDLPSELPDADEYRQPPDADES